MDDAVKKEISGPGKLIDFRAMRKKTREIEGLQVPRELVYAVMTKVDPGGLEETKRSRRDPVCEWVSTSANEKRTLQNTIFFSLF